MQESAASTQYCPDGSPKPPDRGCSDNNPGNPNAPPDKPDKPDKPKKNKKPKYKVKKRPTTGCVNRAFHARITVRNKPSRRKTHVYKNGKLVKSSGKKTFRVRIPAGDLKPGRHRIKLRVRGADGKWYRKTVRFRVCQRD
jgi:hypothetical protein